MRLSNLLRVLIRGSDGQPVWKEITEKTLPRGGKKLSFKNNAVIGIFASVFLITYADLQTDINPDSKWAEYYRKIVRDPMAWLVGDKEHLPTSSDHKSVVN
ncbi:unnamed protein product [Caenorhabditis bovis]|uniref:Uncharacterized protein n=1 Tax=Caenorhabditis bovis TaxID=2654633 RepID=A0A8S1EZP8_9PELO|nr:unnamed protein product [Caenorhabditis bovis]